jgi:hypothetical protein
LSTEPQVVSTSTQPMARRRWKSCIVTPKAGRITTSSAPSRRSRSRRPAAAEEDDPHRGELLVDVRVVDDLAHQEESADRGTWAGLVGVLDRPIHPVAEAELARQPELERAGAQPVVARPEGVDHRARVVGGELPSIAALSPKPFRK